MDDRPSGWYDDPDEPSRLRYWDGQSWTERTHEKAPMPAPQAARQPVTRLRPSREDRDRDGSDDTNERARGDHAGAHDGTSSRQPLTPTESPRPWSTGESRDARSRSAGRHSGTAPSGRGPQDGVVADVPRAGYGRRVLGFLIDLLVVFVLYFVLLLFTIPFLGDTLTIAQAYSESVIQAVSAGQQPPQPPANVTALSATLTLIFAGMLVLYDLVLLRQFGSTLGGLATGVRVRDADATATPTPGRLLLRSVLKYALFVLNASTATALIGYVFTIVNYTWPLADRDRKTLHDKWTRTETVRRR